MSKRKPKFDRDAVLEALKATYEPRIMVWMNKVRDALIAVGATCGPVEDTSVDNYRYALDISFEGRTAPKMKNNVDLGMNFEIVEGVEDGNDKGVNFMFRGVYWGGRIFGLSIEPGNYTPACWVDMTDAHAVEARFSDVEANDPADVAAAIKAEWNDYREIC